MQEEADCKYIFIVQPGFFCTVDLFFFFAPGQQPPSLLFFEIFIVFFYFFFQKRKCSCKYNVAY